MQCLAGHAWTWPARTWPIGSSLLSVLASMSTAVSRWCSGWCTRSSKCSSHLCPADTAQQRPGSTAGLAVSSGLQWPACMQGLAPPARAAWTQYKSAGDYVPQELTGNLSPDSICTQAGPGWLWPEPTWGSGCSASPGSGGGGTALPPASRTNPSSTTCAAGRPQLSCSCYELCRPHLHLA